MKAFRENGAVGALLDEYERAIIDLHDVLVEISHDQFLTVVDSQTDDPDCRSIQTILTHLVRSGYTYALEIKKSQGEEIQYRSKELLETIPLYQRALKTMFQFTEQVFNDYPDLPIEQKDEDKKFIVRWGQKYDVEQLMEHAIVHVLRHRRQIEKFLIELKERGI